ncbi:hypothetical protein AB0D27_11545 [Streptomyces sp. NPDC048415]|uniref:hypothetical protein n=1 Tax=Streptomyces sp. NPDC048415 TaxID=3154822 RepID=UPI0034495F19
MPQPTIGRVVHYRLSEEDVTRCQQQLSHNPPELLKQFNEPRAGQTYAAIVTSVTVHPDHPDVNLRVILDGPYDFFAHSRVQGEEPGTWAWPERV